MKPHSVEEGDQVRIDIPDESDPDFQYHRSTDRVTAVIKDDAASETADPRDTRLYQVELDSGEQVDFRWRDVRPYSDSDS